MFLMSPDFGLEDFAKAIGMVAPRGTTVEMIISPQEINLPQGSGFELKEPVADIPEDESIVYQRTEPILKQTAAPPPPDYSVWEAGQLGRTVPVPFQTPEITDPAELPSPFVKIMNESTLYGTDVQLKGDWTFFPRGTIFHCKKGRVREKQLKERWKVIVHNVERDKKRVLFETDNFFEASEAKKMFSRKIPEEKRENNIISIMRIKD